MKLSNALLAVVCAGVLVSCADDPQVSIHIGAEASETAITRDSEGSDTLPTPVTSAQTEIPETEAKQTAENDPVGSDRSPEPSEYGDAFFDGTVFIGDSIMEGIRRYAAKERKVRTVLGNAQFLTSVSGISLADLVMGDDASIQYVYQGKTQTLESIVEKIAPRRIFLLLGLNDLEKADPNIASILENYMTVIASLQVIVPEADVIVLSNPPKIASSWLPDYTENRNFGNELIDDFVSELEKACLEQGIKYWDLHSVLSNENGALPNEYCNDGFLHLNNSGAEVATNALYDFAQKKEDQ